MQPRADWPELGEDQLDPSIGEVKRGRRWMPPRRLALGGRATAAPVLLFVAAGVALGPQGLNILGIDALARVQAVAWVALAVMGVFLGLALAARSSESAVKMFVSAGVIAITTIGVIAAGLYLLLAQSRVPVPGDIAAGAILVGLCASVSAVLHTGTGTNLEAARASRLADLDDVPLLILGVGALAVLAGGPVALRLLVTVAAGAAIGLAGCLMFERANESERGLFVTGAVLLLAGIGAYLGTSPLLSGCAAAIVWVRVPGTADRITAHDLRLLQHPVVVLLLIIAGAAIEWTTQVLWIAAWVVILRLASKLLASVLVARLAAVSPALLASTLLQPGIMGIAFGLNVWLVLGDDYRWVVSTVAISTVVSEVLAAFLPLGDEAAQ